jgi:glycosyl transferase family 4
MRIAYVVQWSERLDAGVMKKVEAQVAHWLRAGHAVRIFMLRRVAERKAPAVVEAARYIEKYSSMRERFAAVHRLMNAVAEWQPSVVYARYNLWWPSLPRLARRVPVVIEVNADDIIEQKMGYRLPRRVLNRATRRTVLSACSGLVFVTHELARNPRFASFRGRRAVIANSFDLDSARTVPPATTGTHVVFMGTPEPWQGVDHVLHLASLFPAWDFDLVGVSASEAATVPPNVRCHGFLSKADYAPIVGRAHAALGPLALYRNGLKEASPLKVREYLAYGLPTIIAHRDTDFPDGAPFLLRILNEPGGIDRSTDAIRDFVIEWRGRRVDRSSIRHIDMAEKERERLAFFSRVVSREPRR